QPIIIARITARGSRRFALQHRRFHQLGTLAGTDPGSRRLSRSFSPARDGRQHGAFLLYAAMRGALSRADRTGRVSATNPRAGISATPTEGRGLLPRGGLTWR